MSEQEELEKRIIAHCEGLRSILDELRNNTFDREKFDELIDLLKQYHQTLKGQNVMSRTMAGYVDTLHIMVQSTLLYHLWKTGDKEMEKQLTAAYDETLQIISEIYFVD
ncbi:MAG: hypothetical protein AAF787_03155 [Chloroflexota bacterium]